MKKSSVLLLALILLTGFALLVARPTNGAAPETRHVVQPGDTLWQIVAERYAGDPREGIWRVKERNGLATSALTPGLVLTLPAG
ncbi:MAG: LysM peptidoglycan-binding domain-containing protein [Actinobacteria bacterium]|nr:LysM peptidoglycan-binding domain-containing protein [Actinomycetota bacterium]